MRRYKMWLGVCWLLLTFGLSIVILLALLWFDPLHRRVTYLFPMSIIPVNNYQHRALIRNCGGEPTTWKVVATIEEQLTTITDEDIKELYCGRESEYVR